MAAGNWRKQMAPVYERRSGPRKFSPDASAAPASRWDPLLPGQTSGMPARDRFVRSKSAADPLPAADADIAFATLPQLSRWIETRKLTRAHADLSGAHRRLDSKLRCVITLTGDPALAQAKQADGDCRRHRPAARNSVGRQRSADTAGIPTTYGAEPYRNRVPADAAVVHRLHRRGRVSPSSAWALGVNASGSAARL
jgi:hypothetical protein